LTRSTKIRAAGVALLAALLAVVVVMRQMRSEPEAGFGQAVPIQYSFVVSNSTNRAVRDGVLWTYAPSRATPNQHVLSVTASESFDTTDDASGNELMEFRLGLIPPYGQRHITVSAQLAFPIKAGNADAPGKNEWLGDHPGIDSGSAEVQALISGFAKTPTGEEATTQIESWVARNLRVADYDAIERGALHALKERSGDCTEFAYLVVALARAQGLPARAIDGWTSERGGVLEAAEFHTWAEVWTGSRWRVVDAHAMAEGRDRSGYVALRARASDGGDQVVRFRFRGDGLSVRMN
jgi:transglutaminase-like putative cysteine protease